MHPQRGNSTHSGGIHDHLEFDLLFAQMLTLPNDEEELFAGLRSIARVLALEPPFDGFHTFLYLEAIRRINELPVNFNGIRDELVEIATHPSRFSPEALVYELSTRKEERQAEDPTFAHSLEQACQDVDRLGSLVGSLAHMSNSRDGGKSDTHPYPFIEVAVAGTQAREEGCCRFKYEMEDAIAADLEVCVEENPVMYWLCAGSTAVILASAVMLSMYARRK